MNNSCCFYSMCHFCFLTCWTATYRVTPKDNMELNSLSPQEWMLCSMVLFSNITVTTVILLEGKLSGLYVKCWGTSVKCYDVNMHRQSGVVREVAILLVALIFPPHSLYLSISFTTSLSGQYDIFHISGFLSSRSRYSWVNLKSNEWESTTNIFYVFPFCSNRKIKTLR